MQASTSCDGGKLVIGHIRSLTELLGVAGVLWFANVTAALRWRISPRWSTCQDFLAQMNLVLSMLIG